MVKFTQIAVALVLSGTTLASDIDRPLHHTGCNDVTFCHADEYCETLDQISAGGFEAFAWNMIPGNYFLKGTCETCASGNWRPEVCEFMHNPIVNATAIVANDKPIQLSKADEEAHVRQLMQETYDKVEVLLKTAEEKLRAQDTSNQWGKRSTMGFEGIHDDSKRKRAI